MMKTDPLSEVPAHEKWLFENKKALAVVVKGLEESKDGKILNLGSFAADVK